ncbi:hypothetical protein DFAR_2730008 [Desulfarculales bacterium]
MAELKQEAIKDAVKLLAFGLGLQSP